FRASQVGSAPAGSVRGERPGKVRHRASSSRLTSACRPARPSMSAGSNAEVPHRGQRPFPPLAMLNGEESGIVAPGESGHADAFACLTEGIYAYLQEI